jgi:hypothetical protein
MPDDPLLPTTLPITTAALIAGLSPATFKARCIATSAVMIRDGRAVTWDLEKHLGRKITTAEYLSADRARDRARGYQRSYRGKKNL